MSTPVGLKELRKSALRVFRDNFRVKPEESVLLIYDRTTAHIAEAFKGAAGKLNLEITMRKIEPSGSHGAEPDPETAGMMKNHHVIVAPTKYSLTHTKAVRDAKKNGARIATLPGIDSAIFAEGLRPEPRKLKSAGEKWIRILSECHNISVFTALGTDIRFEIGEYAWSNDSGFLCSGGVYGNLPAGEVFIAPNPGTASGTIVVDGTIAGQKWNRNSPPAKLFLENGAVVSFLGKRAKILEATLEKFGAKAFLLAEFGIGTNPCLKMSGNLLGDEKVKGTVHFAFGNNCALGGTNDVPVHLDCLVSSPDIYADGKKVAQKGRGIIWG